MENNQESPSVDEEERNVLVIDDVYQTINFCIGEEDNG